MENLLVFAFSIVAIHLLTFVVLWNGPAFWEWAAYISDVTIKDFKVRRRK